MKKFLCIISALSRIILISIFLSVISCEDILKLNITGDGNIITDSLRLRNNFNIKELELTDNFILEIYHSEKPALYVEADSNLMSYIKTDFLRNKLTIRRQSDHNLKPSRKIIIRLFTDNLSSIDIWNRGAVICDTLITNTLSINIYGKSKFKCKNILVDNLLVKAESGAIADISGDFTFLDFAQTGSGETYLGGSVETLKLKQEGSGKIEALDLEANVAFVSIINSGLIYCNVSTFLDVVINGTGRVYYKGNPEINESITGTGIVSAL